MLGEVFHGIQHVMIPLSIVRLLARVKIGWAKAVALAPYSCRLMYVSMTHRHWLRAQEGAVAGGR